MDQALQTARKPAVFIPVILAMLAIALIVIKIVTAVASVKYGAMGTHHYD